MLRLSPIVPCRGIVVITGRQEPSGFTEVLRFPVGSMVERKMVETGCGGPDDARLTLVNVSLNSGKVEMGLEVEVVAILDVSPTSFCAGEDNPVEVSPTRVGLLALARDSSMGAVVSKALDAATVRISVEQRGVR